MKAPKTSRDWAELWVKLNIWKVFPEDLMMIDNSRSTSGAMRLCEKFCTKAQIRKAWERHVDSVLSRKGSTKRSASGGRG